MMDRLIEWPKNADRDGWGYDNPTMLQLLTPVAICDDELTPEYV